MLREIGLLGRDHLRVQYLSRAVGDTTRISVRHRGAHDDDPHPHGPFFGFCTEDWAAASDVIPAECDGSRIVWGRHQAFVILLGAIGARVRPPLNATAEGHPQAPPLLDLTPEGVDAQTDILLGYASGAIATSSCGFLEELPGEAVLVGTGGRIVVLGDFTCPSAPGIHREGVPTEVISASEGGHDSTHGARGVRRCPRAGHLQGPLVPWRATLEVMDVIDRARAAVGVSHPGEQRGGSGRWPAGTRAVLAGGARSSFLYAKGSRKRERSTTGASMTVSPTVRSTSRGQ